MQFIYAIMYLSRFYCTVKRSFVHKNVHVY